MSRPLPPNLLPLGPEAPAEAVAASGASWVTVEYLRQGYAVLDEAHAPLFGDLRFPTQEAAESYLADANRRAGRICWKLRRPARSRPRSREPYRVRIQLPLF